MRSEITKATEKMVVTGDDVKKFFCPNATVNEIAMFLNVCKLTGLNPFKREAYLVKYGDNPASILTGYEVYLKRAERSDKWAGFKAWTEGEAPDLLAKIEVYRKDWDKPLYHEVEYSEYVGKKQDGTPTRFWKEKPKTMLKKVVISQAFRFAFPDELGGLPYTDAEINTIDSSKLESAPIDVKSTKTEAEPPQSKSGENHANGNGHENVNLISEPQRKRLYAIARGAGMDDVKFKEWLLYNFDLNSSKEVTRDKYDEICKAAEEYKAHV